MADEKTKWVPTLTNLEPPLREWLEKDAARQGRKPGPHIRFLLEQMRQQEIQAGNVA